jgi:hypothetical protein
MLASISSGAEVAAEVVVVPSLENTREVQALNMESVADSGERIDLAALQSSIPPALFNVLSK